MKHIAVILLLSISGLWAEETQLYATPLRISETQSSPREFHVFTAESVKVDLEVVIPVGQGMKMTADVFQVTSGIAAPISSGAVLGEIADFNHPGRVIVPVVVPLPKVERVSEFQVRIKAHFSGNSGSLGQFRVFVHPDDDFKELRDAFPISEDESARMLRVFGPAKKLRALLEERKIAFSDAGERAPDEFRERQIYLGEAKTTEIADRTRSGNSAHIIYFATDEGSAPGVFRNATPNGSVTKITLPILDDLATNPLSRKTFTDAIIQTLQ